MSNSTTTANKKNIDTPSSTPTSTSSSTPFKLTTLSPKEILYKNSDYIITLPDIKQTQSQQKQKCQPTFTVQSFDLIPPLLAHQKQSKQTPGKYEYHLIDGKKRLETVLSQHRNHIPVILLSNATPLKNAFKLMHCYQQDQLKNSAIKTALFISRLQEHQLDTDTIISDFLPNLNCEPNKTTLQKAAKINKLPNSIKHICDNKNLSFKQCLRLTQFPTEILEKSAEWTVTYNLSSSLFIETTETLYDTTYNSDQSLENLLTKNPFTPSSPQHQTNDLKTYLRQLKNPTLTEINTTIQDTIDSCKLENHIKINWDKTCEEKETQITLKIQSQNDLETAIQTLQSEKTKESIEKILKLL